MPPSSHAVQAQCEEKSLFKFQLSFCSNPPQNTCPITSAVLGHLRRTHVLLIFLLRDKKSYRLSEKCATLVINTKFTCFLFNHVPTYRKSGRPSDDFGCHVGSSDCIMSRIWGLHNCLSTALVYCIALYV